MSRIRRWWPALAVCAAACAGSGGAPSAAVSSAGASPHGALPVDCAACHTAEAWTPLRSDPAFDHDDDTRFPLRGRHAAVACAACHLDLRLDQPEAAPDQCSACHVDVHRGRLGEACGECHSSVDFGLVDGGDVHARTGFPLTGSHRRLACERCHASSPEGNFLPEPRECVACHRSDLQSAALDHVGAGFPLTCEGCHSTLAWGSGVAFPHGASTGFPLVGAHARIGCEGCHQIPGFALKVGPPAAPADCVACHRADGDAAHGGAGFPDICGDCHDQSRWTGAEFREHDQIAFPIYRGAHAGRWSSCADCHPGPSTASGFSCVGCHEHSRSRMDDKHREISGYAWESALCLSCHPTGDD